MALFPDCFLLEPVGSNHWYTGLFVLIHMDSLA
jgi:hypothetical protein